MATDTKLTWTDPAGVERSGSELVARHRREMPGQGEVIGSLVRYPEREGFNREYHQIELYVVATGKTHARSLPDGQVEELWAKFAA